MPPRNCQPNELVFCLFLLTIGCATTPESWKDTATAKDDAIASAVQSTRSSPDTSMSLRAPTNQTEADAIADGIYKATGFGNTFLVTTDEGNVVIDTSLVSNAAAHKALLNAVSDKPLKYIVITHAHGDHIGGLDAWREVGTEVIMHKNSVEFLHYQERLSGFFLRRNAAQFGFDLAELTADDGAKGNFAAEIPATILFDDRYKIELGGVTFEIIATPGETYDALSVWIPEKKAVFTGDLFYQAFPNIYTLRGTKPRWALDYVNSLDKVLSLDAEILIPSHGEPIKGATEVRLALTQYRDAILYVHDAVVAGMNAGKDVDTLMDEIRLPAALQIPEIYGKVAWSVHGIYEGYAGWYDGNPSTMLAVTAKNSAAELVALAGGSDSVAAKAAELATNGEYEAALSLADIVLLVDADNTKALGLRREIFTEFLKRANNFNEVGWLRYGIKDAEMKMREN